MSENPQIPPPKRLRTSINSSKPDDSPKSKSNMNFVLEQKVHLKSILQYLTYIENTKLKLISKLFESLFESDPDFEKRLTVYDWTAKVLEFDREELNCSKLYTDYNYVSWVSRVISTTRSYDMVVMEI